MPLARISIRRGKPREYRVALMDGIYQAMRETFNVPEGDKFMVLTQHDEDELVFDKTYFDIQRSDDFVMIQLTVSKTRTLEQKKALFARIVELLAKKPGVRKEDVFINLVEVGVENWSFGNGLAQYVQ